MSRVVSSWLRRKAAVAAEEAAVDFAAQDAVEAETQKALAEKSDHEILEELGLPDPDDLVQGDDFKAFLSKAVPSHLRKRALRKLWRSNPVLACVDRLNDYDDDYLTGSYGQGPIATTYQVGKGMLAHLVEMERQKEALVAVDDETPEDEVAETETLEAASASVVENIAVAKEAYEDTPVVPGPRRMKFQFEGDTA